MADSFKSDSFSQAAFDPAAFDFDDAAPGAMSGSFAGSFTATADLTLSAQVIPITGGKRRRRILLPPGYAPIPRPYRPKEDDEALLLCRVI